MFRFKTAGLTTLAAALIVACSDAPLSPNDATPNFSQASARDDVVPGEVIVKLRDGNDEDAVGRAHGLGASGRGYRNAFVVYSGNAGNEYANANSLKSDSRVEWAEPNYLRQPDLLPQLWAFFNDGSKSMTFTKGRNAGLPLPAQYSPVVDADIDNVETNFGAGGSAVVVGSIDTGVDMDHTEFTGRLIAGADWVANDNNPEDENGHGTHTSGTMAGSTVGVAGVSGAGPNVQVHVQRVCGRRGCASAAIASAIMAAADVSGMVAINLSLGGRNSSQAEEDAIQYAKDQDVLIIASAGNNGRSTVSCPACNADVIAVSATNWSDALASYSNFGSAIDMAAPGGECYSNSTSEGCIYSAYLAGGFRYLQGTSMAAPQVTGAAAVVASVTGLRGAALRARLEGTADDKGDAGFDTLFGNGRLNVYRAVTNTSLPGGQ